MLEIKICEWGGDNRQRLILALIDSVNQGAAS